MLLTINVVGEEISRSIRSYSMAVSSNCESISRGSRTRAERSIAVEKREAEKYVHYPTTTNYYLMTSRVSINFGGR
jgi:hypothetical protein